MSATIIGAADPPEAAQRGTRGAHQNTTFHPSAYDQRRFVMARLRRHVVNPFMRACEDVGRALDTAAFPDMGTRAQRIQERAAILLAIFVCGVVIRAAIVPFFDHPALLGGR